MENIHSTSEQDEQYISFKYLFSICFRNWYWFAISVVVCVGIGCLYILKTQPTYVRTAEILVNDDKKGTTVGTDIAQVFSDLGLSNTNMQATNEVFVMRSPIIMEDVVRDLKLNVSYAKKGLLRNKSLYGVNNPVEIEFIDNPTRVVAYFDLLLKGKKGVLSNFVKYYKGEKFEFPETVDFDIAMVDTVDTPVGRLAIKPNAKFAGSINDELEMKVAYSDVSTKADNILTSLKVEIPDDNASVINISIEDTSLERAEDIINSLIDNYNSSWIENRNEMAKATSKFINERLAVIEGELGHVDENISTFKSQNLIPDVAAVSTLYLSKANATSDEILELNNQLQMANYINDYLNNPVNKRSLLPVNSGIGSASIEQQIGLYNADVLNRDNLVRNSSESNPLVKDYDARIETARQSILVAVQNQIIGLKNSISNLRKSESNSNAKLAANPTQSKYLLSVERQQKVKEALYLFLLQKREENELGQTFAPYNTRIISYARGTELPATPKKFNILLISFFIGLIIPFFVIFMMESLDTSVRSRIDVDSIPAPFLGEIPEENSRNSRLRRILNLKQKNHRLGIIVKHGRNDILNEAFRIVRSNISFMNDNQKDSGKQGGKVIMITSAMPSSGKTFISMNLGAAFALKGKKVVIVDLDMRIHAMSNILAPDRKTGISTCLAGNANINDIIISNVDGYENLSLIPSGPVPPNPAELLDSEELTECIDELRRNYDIVFIDCPPTETITDTRLIAKAADMTIFIIRCGNLSRSMLPEISRIYHENRYPRMSIILNGSNPRKRGYGYAYSYSYGYGGYGNVHNSDKG